MKIGSNFIANLDLTNLALPEARAAHGMHSVKSLDDKSIKNGLAAQYEHAMTTLPVDDQKMLIEKHNDEKLAITLLTVGTGLIDYKFW